MFNVNADLPSSVVNVSFPLWYFVYLPVDNEVRCAENLCNHPMRYSNTTVYEFAASQGHGSLTVPVPIELALALHWVDAAEVERNFLVTDTVLAALRLVQGTS